MLHAESSSARNDDVAMTTTTGAGTAADAVGFYERTLRTPDEWASVLARHNHDDSNGSSSSSDNTAALRAAMATLYDDVAVLTTETNMLAHAAAQLRTRQAQHGGGGATTTTTAASVYDDKSNSSSGGGGGGSGSAAGERDAAMALYTSRSTTESGSLAEVHSGRCTDTTSPQAAATTTRTTRVDQLGRRGRAYQQRTRDGGGGDGSGGGAASPRLRMSVDNKTALLTREYALLRQQDEHAERESEHVHDLLTATVAEAERRMTELRLELRHFAREVGVGNSNDSDNNKRGHTAASLSPAQQPGSDERVCADALVRYMHHRLASQRSYLDKLLGQCQAAEHDIARAQQQLRQSRAAGDAFQPIDFAQLQIENEQLSERVEQRNAELAELKGMSTRTVQILNTLQNQLNEMQSEQARLRKECKSRCEYLARCAKEVDEVRAEAAAAEARYVAIKAQHEAVKVPRIEEYIAQKAELYELQKALHNWSRKVEIAEGQVRVMRQQTRQLTAQRDAAVAYAQNKRQRHAATVQARTRQQQQQQQQQQRRSAHTESGATTHRIAKQTLLLLPPLQRPAASTRAQP